MNTRYEHSDFVKDIAEELIEKLPELEYIKNANPSIAYMESDKKKRSSVGIVFADCEKVKPKMREFMDYDYIITAYIPNCEILTPNQWKVLIFHELLHVDCYRDETGDLITKIRPHDVQEFRIIADKYGNNWPAAAEVEDLLEGK